MCLFTKINCDNVITQQVVSGQKFITEHSSRSIPVKTNMDNIPIILALNTRLHNSTNIT